jgi:hypothetical protein
MERKTESQEEENIHYYMLYKVFGYISLEE